jgi:hypothetical protein
VCELSIFAEKIGDAPPGAFRKPDARLECAGLRLLKGIGDAPLRLGMEFLRTTTGDHAASLR